MKAQWVEASGEEALKALPAHPEIMERERASTLDVAAAALRTENPLSSWVESRHYQSDEPDQPGFNPYDGLPDKYLMYSADFLDVRSPDQLEMKMAEIDRRISDRDLLAGEGVRGLLWSTAAGMTDPVMLPMMFIPGGAVARAGGGALKTGATVAGFGGAEAAATESILHATNPTRTWQESMFAVGATTLLGGALGSLAGAGTKNTLKQLDEAAEELRINAEDGGLQDVGAARTLRGSKSEEGTGRVGPAFSPVTRLLKSSSAYARNFANVMLRHNFYLGKNKQGKATEIPVEVEVIRKQNAMGASAVRTVNEAYQKMAKASTMTTAKVRSKLSFPDFLEEVGKAMRRGDTHKIPEVAEAARALRKDVISPVTKGFQELGDLPEDLTTDFAESYLPRLYDTHKIQKQESEWREMLIRNFVKDGIDEDEAALLADDVTDKILGTPHGRLPRNIVGSTGRIKDRTLSISDYELEPFLISNVDEIMQRYLRETVPELELKRAFGDHELENVVSNIKGEYARLRDGADEKTIRKLRREEKKIINDVHGVRDLLLGRSLNPEAEGKRLTNFMRLSRGLTFMANLGMMTISAIPDVARPIMQHGASAWARALPRQLLYYAKNTKLDRKVLEEMGIGVDSLLSTRVHAMADTDYLGKRMDRWTRTFARHSAMNWWNSNAKRVAAFTAQNRFIGDALKYSKLSARRQERLAKAGIDAAMAKRIAKESREHGEKLAGSWNANTMDWADREAARHFEKVLLKDVDQTIVTPGIGDRPLFASTELGKALFQFKSFFLAAHNQVFIPLAQQIGRKDAAAIEGIIGAIGLGMMSEWVRLNISGRGDEMDDYSMQDWVRAGLDRSGIATVPMELFNITDRMLMGQLSDSLAMKEGSRYFYRNQLSTLMGPSFGYVEDVGNVVQNLAEADGVKESDIRALRRLLPYQNMFYLRQGLNEMEQVIAEQIGAEPNRRRRDKSEGYTP